MLENFAYNGIFKWFFGQFRLSLRIHYQFKLNLVNKACKVGVACEITMNNNVNINRVLGLDRNFSSI